jgi:hypothetical protein
MKDIVKFRFTGILIMLASAAVFGAAVMLLWNALLPQLFPAFPQISYLQAVGLLVLTRLLFGGIGGWNHGGRKALRDGHMFQHGNKLREKWMNMSEEERKEFIEKEKDFFKNRASHFQDFFGDREKPE